MSKPVQLLVLGLMALTLWACVKEVSATQILIVVESELGSDAASYEVRVTDARELAMGQRDVITKPAPFSFALVPAANSPLSTNLIIVSALDASGNVIAIAKSLVTFRDRTAVQVNLRLTQACRGRICDAGFSCDPVGGECIEVQAAQGKVVEQLTPGSEFTMEGMTPGEDGGAGNGGSPAGDGAMSGTTSGMAGGSQGMGGAGGNPSGASPTGGTGSAGGGAPAGGTNAGGSNAGGMSDGGMSDGGAATGGGASEGGTMEAGVDVVPPPECDATRACSTGYTCASGKCVSRCAQTACDPNATCSLNASGTPVCACNSGYLSMTGTGGAVTCTRLQACTELRCDTNATCEAVTGAQPRCVCRSGYTGSGTTCAPVSCGALTVTNGSVQTNGATFGQTAEYVCDNGYVKTGGTARRCEASGVWSGTASTCVGRDCGTPANPSYGRVTVTNGTRYPTGSVRYTCNTGFSLSGSNTDTRTCTASGTWSGTTPTCIGCGDGIVSQSLFEDCEPNASNTWTCIGCKRANAYQPCDSESFCPAGYQCHSAGYCTVAPCSSDAVCPPAPSGPVRASCEGGGFACSLLGCTANSHCPPGLRCNTTERFCTAF